MPSDAGSVLARVRRAATLATCAVLAACAVTSSDGPAPRGLFRADGRLEQGLAPGPRAVWYAAARPRYFEIGLADWREPPARPKAGLRGWLARLKARPAGAQGYPSALIDAHATLALPSIVEVTNLQNGSTVRVRIDRSAGLQGELIDLPATLAASLDAEPGRALMVRVRYAGPAIAFEEPGALRLAWGVPRRSPSSAPTHPMLAQAHAAHVSAAQVPAAEAPIRVAELAPPQAPVAPLLRGSLPAPEADPCYSPSISPAAVCR